MPTDKERLDFLDSLSGTYTGRVILRWSGSGRGWRLHETSGEDATRTTVREAIDDFMSEHTIDAAQLIEDEDSLNEFIRNANG